MTKPLRARLLALLISAVALPLRAAGSTPVAITHVTVVDVATGSLANDMTVRIAGDRIEDVAPSASAKPPSGARVVDGTGKYLIPGLWDMHIHTFFGDWVPGGREVTLPLLLANGITGARDMGSDLDPIILARKDIADPGSMIEAVLLAAKLAANRS